MGIYKKVKDFLIDMDIRCKSAAVAVSGGIDSMALLYIMAELSKELDIKLFCLHFEHGIREESKGDEAFVKEKCGELGVEFISENADIPALAKRKGISLELCAREERYAFFEKICKEKGISVLLTAHHAADNLESILLNFIRGAGASGLTGMAEFRET